jgi:hypothetical protein
MEHYGITGGLEPQIGDRDELLIVDGTEYILTDKFKTMLRDAFIDWGTFLQIYNDNLNYNHMFDQIVKLLNIKENKNLREMMIPLLRKIHSLPAKAHITCMLRQFMIYEPISIVIQAVFSKIKYHYESVVRKFVDVRNAYIKQNNLRVKLNDWDKLAEHWSIENDRQELDSSSIILLMLNPPKKIKHSIHLKIPGLNNIIDPINTGLKKFTYPGFCPKVPHTRLVKLLKFPINEFATAIKKIDPTAELPDYKVIEADISVILSNISPPKVKDIPHKYPPKELVADTSELGNLHMAKWYVNDILDYRKKLLPDGRKYEQHYIDMAKKLNKVHDILKKKLTS